jgi:predicted peroxiredoxin
LLFDAPVVPTSDNPSVSVDMFDDIVGNIDKTEEQAEVETGEWLEQDNFNTAMAFMQGVSLGWYDEYRVGITSLAESALGEETYDQAYARNRAEYDAQAESFQKRQPVAAIGAEIAGAVVSPAAKVGAGIKGARGLVGLTTRGATEGAIYGAGKAKDVDSMAKEAGTGALFGLGSGALIGAGGWLLKKKIAAPLEKDGVFTPITLAAKKDDASESLFQSFYRDVVGPSLGGKGVIRAQEEKVVAPLVLKQAEREKALKDFVRASKAEGAEATAQLRNAVDNVTEAGKVKGVDVAGQAEIAEEIVKGKYDKFLGSKGEIIARKTQQLKNTVESNNDMLRLAAFDNSVPVGAKKADVAKILEAGDPNIAMNQLERLWQKEGFRSIKDISFRMKPEELLGQIEKRVTADTTLSLLAGKAGVRNLIEDGLVTLAAKRNPKTGRISGEDLSAVRNSFGMAASKMSDEGGQAALMQGLYREIQNVIDDNMKKQLSGKRLAAFEGDVASWASQTVLRDAVTRASTKAGRQGRFTADEWIASIKKNSPQQARRGKGPLRAEAEQLAALTAKQEGILFLVLTNWLIN